MSGPRVRIPANVERPDRIIAGLTARQLAIAAAGLVVLAVERSVVGAVAPGPVAVAGGAVVLVVTALLMFGERDALSGDRFAAAALAHLARPRRRVLAPEGVHRPPAPLAAAARPLPSPIDHPVQGLTRDGLLDLGAEGLAVVCRASSVNFGLRTDTEQRALAAAFGRMLNGLSDPVQIVVRTERADTAAAVAALINAAPALPHPGLEAAAREHASFLGGLASRRDVVRRGVFVVIRAQKGADAAGNLSRRVDEAASALSGAGVSLSRLGPSDVASVLAAVSGYEGAPGDAASHVRGRL